MRDDRFNIEELQTRYELEPTLRDVFVEGIFDKELLGEGCSSGINEGRIYYEIDVVNVPDDVVTAAGLTLGQKQRVIALALSLRNVDDACQFRCLVDKDLDGWLGRQASAPRLRWTRYSCIETYFLDSELVRRYMITTAKARIRDWAVFFESFVAVLRVLFALRLADGELGYNLDWVRLDKSLDTDRWRVVFDRDGYTRKVLQTNGLSKGGAAFNESVDRWINLLGGDPRQCVRGHDFLYLMGWAVRRFSGIEAYASEESLARLLVITTHLCPDLMEIVE